MDSRRPKHLVDFHVHIFPEKVAARAVSSLSEAYGVAPVAEPTVGGLTALMDQVGVDVSVVVPVATRADQVASINTWAAQTSSERIVCFGALHPGLDDLGSEVDRIAELGLKGLKLQPNFQQFSPDDPALFPAYEAAQDRLVVLFHSGQEIAPIPRVYARPRALAQVQAAFPRLRMVVAHMGGYQMWDEFREHLLGKDVYLDISYCPADQLSDADMVAMIRAHGAGRVVFATDFPWGNPRADLTRLCGLPLSQDEIESIAWKNARDLLGLALE